MTLLAPLRSFMADRGLDLLFVPSSDEHLNEYLPEHTKRREAVSGFSGSAGDLLIGRETAWLYVDGRYHLQAETEVDTQSIRVEKLGQPDAIPLAQRLRQIAAVKPGVTCGLDPRTVASEAFELTFSGFRESGGKIAFLAENPVDKVWMDRPEAAREPIRALPMDYVGKTSAEKLGEIRADLAEQGCQATVAAALDQVAWLLNRRGGDVAYNPLFEAYAIVLPESAIVFVDRQRASETAFEAPWQVEDIADFPKRLPEIARSLSSIIKSWLIDPETTPLGVSQLLESAQTQIRKSVHPIEWRKSVKNAQEQAAVRSANLLASAAKAKALFWLESEVAAGRPVTETRFAEKLESLYASMEGFQGLSFNTISAAGPNGAVVHYGTPNPQKTLDPQELFLIDSGAHYGGGTTDATRTVWVSGTPSSEQRRLWTLVLKGHVALARQLFPKGTTGVQLDAIARAPLWMAGIDYKHGTGHGVGAGLCVHEGPCSVAAPGRGSRIHRPFPAGYVTSIEPGVYIAGWGGVRLENLYLVVDTGGKVGDKEAFGFDALTLIPFDRRLVDRTLLGGEEIDWLNAYHRRVRQSLAPFMDSGEQAWLERATDAI